MVGPLSGHRSYSHSGTTTKLSMLARLCGRQWQLNKDAAGELRFFGPTSSLHFSESISSSILNFADIDGAKSISHWRSRIPPETQQQLLDWYWTYHHPVLQVVHKKSFIDGMATGRTQYFSELLLCCIFACGARISDRPEFRSLSLVANDTEEDEVPALVKIATALLEIEMKRPSVTTIQSLLLLSVIDCASSNDTRGWLYTGNIHYATLSFPLAF